MKSWVSSAFCDSEFTSKSTRLKASTQKSTSTIKKTLTNLTNQEPAKNKPDSSISLAAKYEPVNRADLSVHKSKIDQLSNLLDDILSKEKGSILLVEGPAGCGKYVTLKVLCREKNVELVEWDHANLNLKSLDLQNEGDFNEPHESQIKLFTQYLFKCSRYESNQLFGKKSSQENFKKVLLVKELPNFAFKDPKVFVNLLHEFKRFSKYSLIFSLTQTNYSDLNPHRIFSSDNRRDLRIVEITFNPIANTYLSKKIDRIAKAEQFSFVDKKFLENLCATSNGDLRHAINLVELTSTGNKVQFSSHQKKSNKKNTEAINFESGSKDANYSIFRGLGKILHRKNIDSNFEDYFLTKHLIKFKRPALANDPEDIYEKIPLRSDLILSYLHQNYIEMYNVKSSLLNFENQFQGLNSICDSFIMSDIINKTSSQFEMGTSTGNQEARLKAVSASISIRSVLFNFYFSSENESKNIWMPLFKPFDSKLIEAKLKRKKMARDFVNLASDTNEKMNKYLIEMNKEFFTEFIPFMQLRSSVRRSGQQKDPFLLMLYKPEFSQLFSKCNKMKSNQQQTTENDYENSQDEQNENVLLIDKQKETNNNSKKGIYVYEDTTCLKIDDFNF